MSTVTQHCIVDLSSNDNFIQVPAVQGDGNDTRFLEIEFVNNGVQQKPDSNCDYYVIGVKSDGKQVWNECSIDGDYVTVELTYQMLASHGRSTYQIMEIPKNGISTLKTFPFGVNVVQTVLDVQKVASSDEWQALISFTKKAEEFASESKGSYEYVEAVEAEAKKTKGEVEELLAQTKDSERIAKSWAVGPSAEEEEGTDEVNARTYAKHAADSDDHSTESADRAKSWATYSTDTNVNGNDTDNAQYWSDKSKEYKEETKNAIVSTGYANLYINPKTGCLMLYRTDAAATQLDFRIADHKNLEVIMS